MSERCILNGILQQSKQIFNCKRNQIINNPPRRLRRQKVSDYMTYKQAIILLSMIEVHGRPSILAKEKAIEALKKQIPKKVLTERNIYICPNCGSNVETDCGDDMLDCRLNYCDNCGQKLDWSEL